MRIAAPVEAVARFSRRCVHHVALSAAGQALADVGTSAAAAKILARDG